MIYVDNEMQLVAKHCEARAKLTSPGLTTEPKSMQLLQGNMPNDGRSQKCSQQTRSCSLLRQVSSHLSQHCAPGSLCWKENQEHNAETQAAEPASVLDQALLTNHLETNLVMLRLLVTCVGNELQWEAVL